MPALETLDGFIRKSQAVHGHKYEYEQVVYSGSRQKVQITCPIHGVFSQTPFCHKQGRGCPSCSTAGRPTQTATEFIAKSQIAHGERYDYSRVFYVGALKHVSIICRVHGAFQQVPAAHQRGQGCPACKLEGDRLDWIARASGRMATLYFIRVYNEVESFYKVGITLRSVAKRYNGQDLGGYNYELVAQHKSLDVAGVYEWEQSILETFSHLAYKPKTYFAGATECFSSCDEILNCFPL